jgi:hypothetical protein
MRTNADQPLPSAMQLAPAAPRTRLWIFLLTMLGPTLATAAWVGSGRGFTLAFLWGTGNRALDALTASATTAIVTAVIALLLARLLARHRLQLSQDGLEVVTTFYRQRLGLRDLRVDRARVVSLGEHPELKPMLKTNGYSLPGFRSGWFRLRNLQRAFVALAGGDRVLWLPTNAGYDLLLQPRQPQALLERLREVTSVADRR